MNALTTDKAMNTRDFENIRIVNADNYSWVKNESIDFILTDPPFNIAQDTNFHTFENNTINSYRFDKDKGWDSYSKQEFVELMDEWAKEFERVLRKGGNFAVFCADEYVSFLINSLSNAGLKPRRTLTWRKPNAVPVNRKHLMMSACEYIVLGVKGSNAIFNSDIEKSESAQLTEQEIINLGDKFGSISDLSLRKELRKLGARPNKDQLKNLVQKYFANTYEDIVEKLANIILQNDKTSELCIPNFVNFNSKTGKRLHPTEKPVDLLIYLISLFSKENETLLDPFAGSGSLGEAAIKTRRNAILVEREEEFFENACTRIKECQNQSQFLID